MLGRIANANWQAYNAAIKRPCSDFGLTPFRARGFDGTETIEMRYRGGMCYIYALAYQKVFGGELMGYYIRTLRDRDGSKFVIRAPRMPVIVHAGVLIDGEVNDITGSTVAGDMGRYTPYAKRGRPGRFVRQDLLFEQDASGSTARRHVTEAVRIVEMLADLASTPFADEGDGGFAMAA